MVDALRVSPAAVLIGQQHPVVPENKIVQEAVKVDGRHIGSGVIGALPRATGEGLVGIAALVCRKGQDIPRGGRPLALQLCGIRHRMLPLRLLVGGRRICAAAARRQGQHQRQHDCQPG